MVKKTRLTKKDNYLIVLGVLIAFGVQVTYELVQEVALNQINHIWWFMQCVFLGLDGFFIYYIGTKTTSE